MNKIAVSFFLIAVMALPGRAEFLQMNISIFGMD